MGGRRPGGLGRLEILGAWLRIWTPPRDAVVPPVPWRAIVAGAVVLLAAGVAAAALLLPHVADERRQAREREQRAEAQRHAEFLASVDREQRPRGGRGRPDPGAGAAPARRRSARNALLASAKSGISLDARRRTRRRVRGVDCTPFPGSLAATTPTAELSRRAAAYQCVAVSARFGRKALPGGRGIIGTPFRLVLRFPTGRYAWCRIVPLGDRDRLSHPLPPACRLR
jgi:hypothetical protein